MILSASRRTDIPACYSDWFMSRIRAGYVLTRNPMNHSQIYRIDLSPEVIDCIVFWTKDPQPIMDKLQVLDSMGYRYYFQFTLTPYGREMETNLRDKKDIIATFLKLSERIGKDRVLWRYDPIILNSRYTLEYHREMFETLCGKLYGYTGICTISFLDLYTKIKGKTKDDKPGKGGLQFREITEDEMHQLAATFSGIGKKYGVKLYACAERIDLSDYGILPASCIDQGTIENICGYTIDAKADRNQRPGCGCIQSIDIGVYNTCINGCLYCYANHSDASINRNIQNHRIDSEMLTGCVKDGETIILRDMKLLRSDQTKWRL